VTAAALHIGAVTRKVSGMLSGIGIRYRPPAGAHHLVGARERDVLLTGEAHGAVRLYEALRDSRFVLVTPPDGDVPLPDGWADRVRKVAAAEATDTIRLIRPDAYVAWASQKPDPAGLTRALARWCGERRQVPVSTG
jgi:hypothetical protein